MKAASLPLHSVEGLGGKQVLLHEQVRVDSGGKQGKLEGLAGSVCPPPLQQHQLDRAPHCRSWGRAETQRRGRQFFNGIMLKSHLTPPTIC